MQSLSYNGSGPVVNAPLTGMVEAAILTPATVIAHARAGRLRMLAVTGGARRVPR